MKRCAVHRTAIAFNTTISWSRLFQYSKLQSKGNKKWINIPPRVITDVVRYKRFLFRNHNFFFLIYPKYSEVSGCARSVIDFSLPKYFMKLKKFSDTFNWYYLRMLLLIRNSEFAYKYFTIAVLVWGRQNSFLGLTSLTVTL